MFNDLDDNVKINNLPAFPKKRMFNTLEPKFLNDRMVQLGHFFNTCFSNSEIARNRLVIPYFAGAPGDEQSQQRILNLSY